jgi:ABC-type antimicrobial peptide transport system permease subunit
MNYKYNELAYVEKIYNNGFQTKHLPTEIRLLVLYFRDILEYKPKEREYKIYEFCKKNIPNFRKERFYTTINKALRAGEKKNQKLITISKIDIYKTEVDYINSLDVNQDYKKVLFTFLVQKKLNKIVYEYKNNNKNNNKNNDNNNEYNMLYFKGGTKKYNNIKRISNIPIKILLNDEIVNTLAELKLITIIHKGTILLDYIQNCRQEGDIVFTINDFDNIGLYLDFYNGIKGVIKCENCNKIIKPKNNKQKYCEECAVDVDRIKAKERMQNIRMFEIENV